MFCDASRTSGLFSRWRKTKPESADFQIGFSAPLRLLREDGRVDLELLLVNRSDVPDRVGEARLVLSELETNWRTSIFTRQARCEVLQNRRPADKKARASVPADVLKPPHRSSKDGERAWGQVLHYRDGHDIGRTWDEGSICAPSTAPPRRCGSRNHQFGIGNSD
jgi:hypothetical protein